MSNISYIINISILTKNTNILIYGKHLTLRLSTRIKYGIMSCRFEASIKNTLYYINKNIRPVINRWELIKPHCF